MNIALALVILVAGMITVVAIAEKQSGANAEERPRLTLADVERALRARGLDVSPTGRTADRPRIPVVGHELQVEGVTVEVYLFPSVAQRVNTEQRLVSQARFIALDVTMSMSDSPRMVSARNVLIMFTIEDATLSAQIHRAMTDLARSNP